MMNKLLCYTCTAAPVWRSYQRIKQRYIVVYICAMVRLLFVNCLLRQGTRHKNFKKLHGRHVIIATQEHSLLLWSRLKIGRDPIPNDEFYSPCYLKWKLDKRRYVKSKSRAVQNTLAYRFALRWIHWRHMGVMIPESSTHRLYMLTKIKHHRTI